jgi:hypothetical protein
MWTGVLSGVKVIWVGFDATEKKRIEMELRITNHYQGKQSCALVPVDSF